MSENVSGSPVLSDTTDASIHGTLLRNSTFISPKSFIENETVLRDCSNISVDRIRGDTTFIQKVKEASDISSLENGFPRGSLSKKQVKKKESKTLTNSLSDTLSDNSLSTWEHNNAPGNHLSAEAENVALEEKLYIAKNSLDESSDKISYKLGKSICEVKISFDSPEKKKLNKTVRKEKSKNRTSEIKSPFKKVSINFNTDSSVDSVNSCSIDKHITNCNSSKDDLDLSKSLVNNSSSSIRNSRNLKRKHVEFDLNNSREKSMNSLDNSTLKSHTKQYEEKSLPSFPIGLNTISLKSGINEKLLDQSWLDSEENKSSSNFVMDSVKLAKRVRSEGSLSDEFSRDISHVIAINSDSTSTQTSCHTPNLRQSSEISEIKNQNDFDCTGVDLQSSGLRKTPVYLDNSCPITNDITPTSRVDSSAGYPTEGNTLEISKSKIKKPNQKLKKVSVKFNLSNSSEMEHSSVDSENFTKVQKSILRRSTRLSRGLCPSVQWNMDNSITNKFKEEKSLHSENTSELNDKLALEAPNIVNPSSTAPSHRICTNFTHTKNNESINTTLDITGLNMSTSTQIGEDEKLTSQNFYNSPVENKNTSIDQTAKSELEEINLSNTKKKISVCVPPVQSESQVSENMLKKSILYKSTPSVLELQVHQTNVVLEINKDETISGEALYHNDKNNTLQDIEEKSTMDLSTMAVEGTNISTCTELSEKIQTSKHIIHLSNVDDWPNKDHTRDLKFHDSNILKTKRKVSVHFALDNADFQKHEQRPRKSSLRKSIRASMGPQPSVLMEAEDDDVNKTDEVLKKDFTQTEDSTVQDIEENSFGENKDNYKKGQNLEEATKLCDTLPHLEVSAALRTSLNSSCENSIKSASGRNNSTMDVEGTNISKSTVVSEKIQTSQHILNLSDVDTCTNKDHTGNMELNESNRLKSKRKVSVHFAFDNTDSQTHEQRPRKSSLRKSTRASMGPQPNILMEMDELDVKKTDEVLKKDFMQTEESTVQDTEVNSIGNNVENVEKRQNIEEITELCDSLSNEAVSVAQSTSVDTSCKNYINSMSCRNNSTMDFTATNMLSSTEITEEIQTSGLISHLSKVDDCANQDLTGNMDLDDSDRLNAKRKVSVHFAFDNADSQTSELMSRKSSFTSCKNYINSMSCRNNSTMDFTATNMLSSTEITEQTQTSQHILQLSHVDESLNTDHTGNVELDDSTRLIAKRKVSVHFAFDNADSQASELMTRKKSLRKCTRASMGPQPNVLMEMDEDDVNEADEVGVIDKNCTQVEDNTVEDAEENSFVANDKEKGQNIEDVTELCDALSHKVVSAALSTSLNSSSENSMISTSCRNNSTIDIEGKNISKSEETQTSQHILQLSNVDESLNTDHTGNMELDDSTRLIAKRKVSVHFAFDNADSQTSELMTRKKSLHKSTRASMGPQPNVLMEMDEDDVNDADGVKVMDKNCTQVEDNTVEDAEENSFVANDKEKGQNIEDATELCDALSHKVVSAALSTSLNSSSENSMISTSCRNNSTIDIEDTNISKSEQTQTSQHILQLSHVDESLNTDHTGNVELDDSTRLIAKRKVSVHFAFDNADSQASELMTRKKSLRKCTRASMGPQPNVLMEMDEDDVNDADGVKVIDKNCTQVEDNTVEDAEENSFVANDKEKGQNIEDATELCDALSHKVVSAALSTSLNSSSENSMISTSCRNSSTIDIEDTNISKSEETQTSQHILQLSNVDESLNTDHTGNMELDDSTRLIAKRKVSVHFAFDSADSQTSELMTRKKSLRKSTRVSMGPQPNVLIEMDEDDVNKTVNVLKVDCAQTKGSTLLDKEENSIGENEDNDEKGLNIEEATELCNILPHEAGSAALSNSLNSFCENSIKSARCRNNSTMDFTDTNMSSSTEITEDIQTNWLLSNVDDCPNQDLTENMDLDDSNRLKAKRKVSVQFALDNADSQIHEQRPHKSSLRKSIRAFMGPQPNVLMEMDEDDVNKTDKVEMLNKDGTQTEDRTVQDKKENSIGENEDNDKIGTNIEEGKELCDTLSHEAVSVAQSTLINPSCKNYINSMSCRNDSAMDFNATNMSTSTELTEEIQTSRLISHLSNLDDCANQDLTGNMDLDDSDRLNAKRKVSVHFAFDNADSQISDLMSRKSSLRKSIRASICRQPNVLMEMDEDDVKKTEEVLKKDCMQAEDRTAQDTEETSIRDNEEYVEKGQNIEEIMELCDTLSHKAVAQSSSVDTYYENSINSMSRNNCTMDLTATNMSTSTEVTEEIQTSGLISHLSKVDDCPNMDHTEDMELNDSTRLIAKRKVSIHFAFDNADSHTSEFMSRKSLLRKSTRASMGPQPNVLMEMDEDGVKKTNEVLKKDCIQTGDTTVQDIDAICTGENEVHIEERPFIGELNGTLSNEISCGNDTSLKEYSQSSVTAVSHRNSSAMDVTGKNMLSSEITEGTHKGCENLNCLSEVKKCLKTDLTKDIELDDSNRLKSKKKLSVHFAFDNTVHQRNEESPRKSSLRKSTTASMGPQPNVLLEMNENDVKKTDVVEVHNQEGILTEDTTVQDKVKISIRENEDISKIGQKIEEDTDLCDTLSHEAGSVAQSTSINSSCKNYINSMSCRNNSTMDFTTTNMSSSTEVTEEIKTSGLILDLTNVDDCPNQDLIGDIELDDADRLKAKRKVSVQFAFDNTDSQKPVKSPRKSSLRRSTRASICPQPNVLMEMDEDDVNKTDDMEMLDKDCTHRGHSAIQDAEEKSITKNNDYDEERKNIEEVTELCDALSNEAGSVQSTSINSSFKNNINSMSCRNDSAMDFTATNMSTSTELTEEIQTSRLISHLSNVDDCPNTDHTENMELNDSTRLIAKRKVSVHFAFDNTDSQKPEQRPRKSSLRRSTRASMGYQPNVLIEMDEDDVNKTDKVEVLVKDCKHMEDSSIQEAEEKSIGENEDYGEERKNIEEVTDLCDTLSHEAGYVAQSTSINSTCKNYTNSMICRNNSTMDFTTTNMSSSTEIIEEIKTSGLISDLTNVDDCPNQDLIGDIELDDADRLIAKRKVSVQFAFDNTDSQKPVQSPRTSSLRRSTRASICPQPNVLMEMDEDDVNKTDDVEVLDKDCTHRGQSAIQDAEEQSITKNNDHDEERKNIEEVTELCDTLSNEAGSVQSTSINSSFKNDIISMSCRNDSTMDFTATNVSTSLEITEEIHTSRLSSHLSNIDDCPNQDVTGDMELYDLTGLIAKRKVSVHFAFDNTDSQKPEQRPRKSSLGRSTRASMVHQPNVLMEMDEDDVNKTDDVEVLDKDCTHTEDSTIQDAKEKSITKNDDYDGEKKNIEEGTEQCDTLSHEAGSVAQGTLINSSCKNYINSVSSRNNSTMDFTATNMSSSTEITEEIQTSRLSSHLSNIDGCPNQDLTGDMELDDSSRLNTMRKVSVQYAFAKTDSQTHEQRPQKSSLHRSTRASIVHQPNVLMEMDEDDGNKTGEVEVLEKGCTQMEGSTTQDAEEKIIGENEDYGEERKNIEEVTDLCDTLSNEAGSVAQGTSINSSCKDYTNSMSCRNNSTMDFTTTNMSSSTEIIEEIKTSGLISDLTKVDDCPNQDLIGDMELNNSTRLIAKRKVSVHFAFDNIDSQKPEQRPKKSSLRRSTRASMGYQPNVLIEMDEDDVNKTDKVEVLDKGCAQMEGSSIQEADKKSIGENEHYGEERKNIEEVTELCDTLSNEAGSVQSTSINSSFKNDINSMSCRNDSEMDFTATNMSTSTEATEEILTSGPISLLSNVDDCPNTDHSEYVELDDSSRLNAKRKVSVHFAFDNTDSQTHKHRPRKPSLHRSTRASIVHQPNVLMEMDEDDVNKTDDVEVLDKDCTHTEDSSIQDAEEKSITKNNDYDEKRKNIEEDMEQCDTLSHEVGSVARSTSINPSRNYINSMSCRNNSTMDFTATNMSSSTEITEEIQTSRLSSHLSNIDDCPNQDLTGDMELDDSVRLNAKRKVSVQFAFEKTDSQTQEQRPRKSSLCKSIRASICPQPNILMEMDEDDGNQRYKVLKKDSTVKGTNENSTGENEESVQSRKNIEEIAELCDTLSYEAGSSAHNTSLNSLYENYINSRSCRNNSTMDNEGTNMSTSTEITEEIQTSGLNLHLSNIDDCPNQDLTGKMELDDLNRLKAKRKVSVHFAFDNGEPQRQDTSLQTSSQSSINSTSSRNNSTMDITITNKSTSAEITKEIQASECSKLDLTNVNLNDSNRLKAKRKVSVHFAFDSRHLRRDEQVLQKTTLCEDNVELKTRLVSREEISSNTTETITNDQSKNNLVTYYNNNGEMILEGNNMKKEDSDISEEITFNSCLDFSTGVLSSTRFAEITDHHSSNFQNTSEKYNSTETNKAIEDQLKVLKKKRLSVHLGCGISCNSEIHTSSDSASTASLAGTPKSNHSLINSYTTNIDMESSYVSESQNTSKRNVSEFEEKNVSVQFIQENLSIDERGGNLGEIEDVKSDLPATEIYLNSVGSQSESNKNHSNEPVEHFVQTSTSIQNCSSNESRNVTEDSIQNDNTYSLIKDISVEESVFSDHNLLEIKGSCTSTLLSLNEDDLSCNQASTDSATQSPTSNFHDKKKMCQESKSSQHNEETVEQCVQTSDMALSGQPTMENVKCDISAQASFDSTFNQSELETDVNNDKAMGIFSPKIPHSGSAVSNITDKSFKEKNSISVGNESNKANTFSSTALMESQFFNSSDSCQKLSSFNNKNTEEKVTPFNVSVHIGFDSTCQTSENVKPRDKAFSGGVVSCDSLQVQPSMMSMKSGLSKTSDKYEVSAVTEKSSHIELGPKTVSVNLGLDTISHPLGYENTLDSSVSERYISSNLGKVVPTTPQKKLDACKTTGSNNLSKEENKQKVSGFDNAHAFKINESPHSSEPKQNSVERSGPEISGTASTFVSDNLNEEGIKKIMAPRNVSVHIGFDTTILPSELEKTEAKESLENKLSDNSRSSPTSILIPAPTFSENSDDLKSDDFNKNTIEDDRMVSRKVSVHSDSDFTMLPSGQGNTEPIDALENDNQSNSAGASPSSTIISEKGYPENTIFSTAYNLDEESIEKVMGTRNVSVHIGFDTTTFPSQQENTAVKEEEILKNNPSNIRDVLSPTSETEFSKSGASLKTTNLYEETFKNKNKSPRDVSVHLGFDTTTLPLEQENAKPQDVENNLTYSEKKSTLSSIISKKGLPGTTSDLTINNLNEETNRKVMAPRNVSVHFGFDSTTFPSQQEDTNETLDGNSTEFSKIGASLKTADIYEETFKNKNNPPRNVSVHFGFDTTAPPLEQENAKLEGTLENNLNRTEKIATLSTSNSDKRFSVTTTVSATDNLNEETNKKIMDLQSVSGRNSFDTTTPSLEQENAKPEAILENNLNRTEKIATLSTINSDKIFPEITPVSATDNINEETNKKNMDTQNISGRIGFDSTTPPLEQENAKLEGIVEDNRNYRETGAPLSTPISVSVFSNATPTLATEKLNVESIEKVMTTRNVSVHIGFDSTISPSQQESTKETVEKKLNDIHRGVQSATVVSETELSKTCTSLNKTADEHSFKNNNNSPREVSVHIGFDTTAPPLEEENAEPKEIVDDNPNYSVTEASLSLSKAISETRFSVTRTDKLYEESIKKVKTARNVSVHIGCDTTTLISQESTVAKETLENNLKNIVKDSQSPSLLSETEFAKITASPKATDLHEDNVINNEKAPREPFIITGSDTTIQEQENSENKRIQEHNNLSKSERKTSLSEFSKTAVVLTSDYKHEESIGVAKQNISVHLGSDTTLPSHQKNTAAKVMHESSPNYNASNSLGSAIMTESRFSLISDDLKSYKLKEECDKSMITKKSVNIGFDSSLHQSRVENSSLKGDFECIVEQKSFGSGINGPAEENNAPNSSFSNESSIPVGNAGLVLSGTKNITPTDIENESHIIIKEHQDLDLNKCDERCLDKTGNSLFNFSRKTEKDNCIKINTCNNTSNTMPFTNSSGSETSSTLLKVITNDKEQYVTDHEEPSVPLDSVRKSSSDSSLPFTLSLSLTDENSNHSNSSHSLAKELVNEDIDCIRQANNLEESPQFSESLVELKKVGIMRVSGNNDSLVLEDVPGHQTRNMQPLLLHDNINDIVSPTATLCIDNNLSKVKKVSLVVTETLEGKKYNASFTESIREDSILKKESAESFKRTPKNVSNKNINLNSDEVLNSNKSNSVNKRATRSSTACSQGEPSNLNNVEGLHLDQNISHEKINAQNSKINCLLAKTAEKVSSGESHDEFTTVKFITEDELCLRKSCGNDLLSNSHDPFLPIHVSGNNITNEDISYVIGTSRISMSNETLEISGRCNEVADNKCIFDISLASNPNLENDLVEKHSLNINNTSCKNSRAVHSRKRSNEDLHKLPKSQNSGILKTEYTNDSKGNRYSLRKSNTKSTSVNTDSEKHLKRKSVRFTDTVDKSVSPDKSAEEGPPQKKNRECLENKPALNTSSLGSHINLEEKGEGKENSTVSDHIFVCPQEPQYKLTDRARVSNYKRSRSPEEKQPTSSDNSINYSKRKKTGDDKTINDLSNDSVDVSEIPRDRTVAPRKIIYHSTPINPVFERSAKGRPRKSSRENSSKNNTDKIIQVSKSIFGTLSEGVSSVGVKNKSSDLSSSYSLGGKSSNKLKMTSASNRTSDSRDLYSEKSIFSIPRSSKNYYSTSTFSEVSSQVPTKSVRFKQQLKFRDFSSKTGSSKDISSDKTYTSRFTDLSGSMLSTLSNSFQASRLSDSFKKVCFRDNSSHIENTNSYSKDQSQYNVSVSYINTSVHQSEPRRYLRGHIETPHRGKKQTDTVNSDVQNSTISSIAMRTADSEMPTLTSEFLDGLTIDGMKYNERGVLKQPMYTDLKHVAPKKRNTSQKVKFPEKWVSLELFKFFYEKLKPIFSEQATVMSEDLIGHFCVMVNTAKYLEQIRNIDTLVFRNLLSKYNICNNYLEYYTLISKYAPFDFQRKVLRLGGYFSCGLGGTPMNSKMNISDPILNESEKMEVSLC